MYFGSEAVEILSGNAETLPAGAGRVGRCSLSDDRVAVRIENVRFGCRWREWPKRGKRERSSRTPACAKIPDEDANIVT